MIVFREDKTYEEEIKTWQFWHSRQHSVKQRILEIDAKNSSGMIGQIEEIAHNAIQFYWNPTEQSSVKVSFITIIIINQSLSVILINQVSYHHSIYYHYHFIINQSIISVVLFG